MHKIVSVLAKLVLGLAGTVLLIGALLFLLGLHLSLRLARSRPHAMAQLALEVAVAAAALAALAREGKGEAREPAGRHHPQPPNTPTQDPSHAAPQDGD